MRKHADDQQQRYQERAECVCGPIFEVAGYVEVPPVMPLPIAERGQQRA